MPSLVRRAAPPTAITGFLLVSAGLHAVAWLASALWLPIPPASGEVPATIEVVFGDNADSPGARARPTPPASAKTPSASGLIAAAPPAAPGDVAAAPHPAPAAPPAAVAAPVRLGDGDVGLKVDAPDPNMIEAQADPHNDPPKFPDIAWSQHQSGRVALRLHVDIHGRVVSIELLHSSGYPALDLAARMALAKWHFIPALRDGVAVPSFRDQEINFVAD